MNFLSLILLLFCHHWVFAKSEITRGIVQHIDWVQNAVQPRGIPTCEHRIPLKVFEEPQSLAQLCMTQICGLAEEVTSIDEMIDELGHEWKIKEEIDKEHMVVKSEISRLLDENEKSSRLKIEFYKNLKARGKIKVSEKYKSVETFNILAKNLPKSIYKAGPSWRQPLLVDRDRANREFRKLPKAQREWLIESIDHFTRSPIGSDFIVIFMAKPKRIMKLMHPNLSFKKALAHEAKYIQDLDKQLLTNHSIEDLENLGIWTEDKTVDKIIAKAANGQKLTEAEVSQFLVVRQRSPVYSDLLTPRSAGGQRALTGKAYPESFDDYIRRIKFDKQIFEYEKDINDTEKMKNERMRVYERCLSSYRFQLATLPDGDQLKIARENEKWAKNRAKEVLNTFVSTETALNGIVKTKIDKSFFDFPRERAKFHKYFISNLRAETSERKEISKKERRLLKGGGRILGTINDIRYKSESYELSGHFRITQKVCNEFKPKSASDDVLTSTGGINASWITVKYPRLGKSIMLHELGHISFDLLNSNEVSEITREKMNSVKKCLSQNHASGDGLKAELYNEDDWSDLFTAKASKNLEKNSTCNLTHQEDDAYVDLDLPNFSTTNQHSSYFFRVIHSFKVKSGKLKSACLDVIKRSKGDWRFKDCFLPE